MKLLLVDDDPVFLDYLESELNKIDTFEVVTASSAAEGLDIVDTLDTPFDCFLLDIDMPGMNGIELCAELRQRPSVSGTPILMVTVLTEVENMDKAFAAGATDYLNKPLVTSELRGRLRMARAKMQEMQARVSLLKSVKHGTPLKITDRVKPDDVPYFVDFPSLENYAFRLGSDQLCKRQIFGLHVANVAEIFASKDSAAFKATLNELSQIIVESLGTGHKVMAYAGLGEFVVVLGETTPFDLEAIKEYLKKYLLVLERRGQAVGDIVPQVKIGVPINAGLFSCANPDEILCIASGLAREYGTLLNTPAPIPLASLQDS